LQKLADLPEERPLREALPELILIWRSCVADLREGRLPFEELPFLSLDSLIVTWFCS